ncbi:MAG: hypothetical protein Q7K21_04930, partial [Elusimicrobiota bacterium]|nr:hypothetical protein [Elusimicrobiota bacterium]
FINASAGASPVIGKRIGQQQGSTKNSMSTRFYEAFVKKSIPEWKLELRAGYLNIPFTQDYGKTLFWHEEFNSNQFTHGVGVWHDTGIEAYRNFEAGSVSLPMYLYFLNGLGGTSSRDNNKDKTILFHAEPEFSGALAGLKTFLSYGFGKWGDTEWDSDYTAATPAEAMPGEKDQKYNRWSVGTSYDYRKFSVRAETGQYSRDNYFNFGTTTEADKESSGYYAKLFYKVIPDKLTAMLDYSLLNNDTSATVSEERKTTILGLQYELAEAMTCIVQFDMADWKNDEEPAATAEDSLKFNRLVMGIRTTF